MALARALAIEPKVLLLDEPFGALDAKVRKGLREWLRRLHDEIHITSVLVTHDQEEALEVADRVVVMNNAKIEQIGTPAEVFHQPASEFVMEFLGQVNVFRGRMHDGGALVGNTTFDVPGVRGLAFLGFPLHPAGKPSDERAAHLADVRVPMLFLQGMRDDLATLSLLRPVVARLGAAARLELFDDADHSFHVRARSRRTDVDVLAALADSLAAWIDASIVSAAMART